MRNCFISVFAVLIILYVSAGCAGGPDVEMQKNLQTEQTRSAKLAAELENANGLLEKYKQEQIRLNGFIEERDRLIGDKAAQNDALEMAGKKLQAAAEDADKRAAALKAELETARGDAEKAKTAVAELEKKLQNVEGKKNDMELQCMHLRDKIAALERELENAKKPKTPEGGEKK
jgi:chromosome segregation ATPase